MASYPDTSQVPVEVPGSKVELKGPFWLTRNKVDGVLRDGIEVWVKKPELHRFDDGDVMWLPSLEYVDKEDTYYATWTIAKCLKEMHVYPETERECIVHA